MFDILKFSMPYEKYNSYKNFAHLFIAILVVVGGYQILAGFRPKNNSINKEVSSNAYFQPPSVDSQNKSLSGIIKLISEMDGVTYKYGLYDTEGKLISYLVSTKLDFGLSTGLNVEVNGKYTVSNGSGYAIMEVNSVKLK